MNKFCRLAFFLCVVNLLSQFGRLPAPFPPSLKAKAQHWNWKRQKIPEPVAPSPFHDTFAGVKRRRHQNMRSWKFTGQSLRHCIICHTQRKTSQSLTQKMFCPGLEPLKLQEPCHHLRAWHNTQLPKTVKHSPERWSSTKETRKQRIPDLLQVELRIYVWFVCVRVYLFI